MKCQECRTNILWDVVNKVQLTVFAYSQLLKYCVHVMTPWTCERSENGIEKLHPIGVVREGIVPEINFSECRV